MSKTKRHRRAECKQKFNVERCFGCPHPSNATPHHHHHPPTLPTHATAMAFVVAVASAVSALGLEVCGCSGCWGGAGGCCLVRWWLRVCGGDGGADGCRLGVGASGRGVAAYRCEAVCVAWWSASGARAVALVAVAVTEMATVVVAASKSADKVSLCVLGSVAVADLELVLGVCVRPC